MNDTTGCKPIGRCERCGYDLYEYMTHSCPTASLNISTGTANFHTAPAPPSGEEEARALVFVYKDGVSRTLSQVESGAGRYVEIDRVEFHAQHYKLDDDEEVAELLAAYAAQQKERDAKIAESIGHTGKYIARSIREQQ